MKRGIKFIGLLALLSVMTMACEKNGRDDRTGTLSVRMKNTETITSFDEVNVEVRHITVRYADASGKRAEWIDVNTQGGVYNLLDLQHGASVAVVTNERVRIGRLTQLRVHFGNHHSVRHNGELHPLLTGAPLDSEELLNLDVAVTHGDKVEIVFSLDSDKSVVLHENGNYSFNPMAKVESITHHQ